MAHAKWTIDSPTGKLERRLSSLEVVEEDLKGGRVLTVVGDDDARASDNLSGLALSVDFL